jgi:hypothetical protein
MQIYELTQSKKPKLDEANPLAAVTGAVGNAVAGAKNLGTKIASPFKNAGSAYTSGQISAKTNSLGDKAFRAWSQFANQRMASMDDTEKQAYVAGTDGKMHQDLTAFVQKNMLGNQPFDNLTVGDDILKVINQIAPGGSPAGAATPPAAVAGKKVKQPVAKPTTASTPSTPSTPSTNPANAIAQQRQQKLGAAAKVAQDQMAANPVPEKPVAQSPEEIRKEKLSAAAKVAQDQMAANPGPSVPQSPEEIRKAKQATAAQAAQDQMAGKPPVTPAATTPNFGARIPGYGPVTSNVPSAIPNTNMKLPANMGAGAKATPVTPVAKVPKVTSGGPTPDERAAYDAKLKAALAKQNQHTVTEAVKYEPSSQSKALFLKLAQLAATSQRSADTPGTTPASGQYQQTQQSGSSSPIATALGRAGVNTKQLAALGSAIAPNAKINTTGNTSVDALLKNMGFTVQ